MIGGVGGDGPSFHLPRETMRAPRDLYRGASCFVAKGGVSLLWQSLRWVG